MKENVTIETETTVTISGKVTFTNPDDLLKSFNEIMFEATLEDIAKYVLRLYEDCNGFIEGVGKIGTHFDVEDFDYDVEN